jgi:hypothetical protein
MKWFNVQKDILPPAKKKVIISAKGVNYTACFDDQRKIFIAHTDEGEKIIPLDHQPLYWTDNQERQAG